MKWGMYKNSIATLLGAKDYKLNGDKYRLITTKIRSTYTKESYILYEYAFWEKQSADSTTG